MNGNYLQLRFKCQTQMNSQLGKKQNVPDISKCHADTINLYNVSYLSVYGKVIITPNNKWLFV